MKSVFPQDAGTRIFWLNYLLDLKLHEVQRGIVAGCEVQLVRARREPCRLQVQDVEAVRKPEGVILVCTAGSDHVSGSRRGYLLDVDCMNKDTRRRHVVAVDVAELNLDRVCNSTLHGLRLIVEHADVERD